MAEWPPELRIIAYDFPIRPDVIIRLTLPVDLTTADAERLIGFIKGLAFDPARLTEEATG